MKFIRVYEDNQTFVSEYEGLDYIEPWTSCVRGEDDVYFNKAPYEMNTYLTFKALEAGTFKLTRSSVQYSLDEGQTWVTLSSNTNTPTIPAGGTIKWKAVGISPTDTYGIGTFSSTGYFDAYGNIMSLVEGDRYKTASLSWDNQFASLFKNATKLKSAKYVLMPSTATINCYDSMFEGCTNLTAAPALPATSVMAASYRKMFKDCKSLLSCPDLPATSLGTNCYQDMFNGCSNLVHVPTILPATTLDRVCYYNMFRDCEKIRRGPDLPAATLTDYCYEGMFAGCLNMTYLKCLAVTKTATQCTNWWLPHPYIAEVGTFVKASSATWTRGDNGIPTGWIIENA